MQPPWLLMASSNSARKRASYRWRLFCSPGSSRSSSGKGMHPSKPAHRPGPSRWHRAVAQASAGAGAGRAGRPHHGREQHAREMGRRQRGARTFARVAVARVPPLGEPHPRRHGAPRAGLLPSARRAQREAAARAAPRGHARGARRAEAQQPGPIGAGGHRRRQEEARRVCRAAQHRDDAHQCAHPQEQLFLRGNDRFLSRAVATFLSCRSPFVSK